MSTATSPDTCSLSNKQYLAILKARHFIGATNSGSTERINDALRIHRDLTVLLHEVPRKYTRRNDSPKPVDA